MKTEYLHLNVNLLSTTELSATL